MQMACIEAARNLAGIKAQAPPSSARRAEPIVGLMTEWMKGNELEKRQANGDLGGTMRLGAYDAVLEPGSQRRRDLWHDAASPNATATATK